MQPHSSEIIALMLEADPERQAVEKYLDKCEVYVMRESGRVVSEISLYRRDDGHVEIKNIATVPDQRGLGHAGELIKHAMKLCESEYSRMYVGTSDDMIPYYEQFGFKKDYVVKDFFVDNYDEPVVENGRVLHDMQYLSLELK